MEMKFSGILPSLDDCAHTVYNENRFGIKPRHGYGGEDYYIIDIFNGKRNGFFIDIGSADPTSGSNTFHLEKTFGWNGLLIEANHFYYDEVIKQRTSKFYECYLSVEKGIGNYKTIGEIFAENVSLIPNFIDFLSFDIDATQDEFLILSQFDFKKYTVGAFVIEHDLYCDKSRERVIKRKKINTLLLANDYVYEGNISVNDCYVHKSVYEEVRKNKNPKYHHTLSFDL